MRSLSWKGRIGLWLLVGFGLSVILLGMLAWQLPWLLGRLAEPHIERRSARLEIEAVEWSLSRITLVVGEYREPYLSVRGLRLSGGWAPLLLGRLPADMEFRCGELSLDVAENATVGDRPALDPAALLRRPSAVIADALAEGARRLQDLPDFGVTGSIETFTLRSDSDEATFGVDVVGRAAGDSGLSVDLELSGEGLVAEAQLRGHEGGRRLGLDFNLSVSDAAAVLDRLDRLGFEAARKLGYEVYPNALEGSDLLGGVSGYLRWDADRPDAVRMIALGNFGPVDVFGTRGDLALGNWSFGVAVDESGPLKGYLTLPLESLAWEGWSEDGGEIEFVLGEGGWSLEGRLGPGPDLELGVRAAGFEPLLSGNGELEVALTMDPVDAAVFRAFAPGRFGGWTMEGAAGLDARLQLSDWAVRDLSGQARLRVDRAESGAEDRIRSLDLQTRFSGWSGRLLVGELDVSAESVAMAGLFMDGLEGRIEAMDTGGIEMHEVELGLLGGRAWVEALHLPSGRFDSLEPVPLRLDGIDLEALAELVPQFKGEISGRVSGMLTVGWNEGLVIRGGRLELDRSPGAEGAHLSYPVEGLLTRGLDEGSSSYRQYRLAEQALGDLRVSRLSLEFFPGDERDRPIQVRLYGESEQEAVVVPVDFTLNVNAEEAARLMELIRTVREGRLDISW